MTRSVLLVALFAAGCSTADGARQAPTRDADPNTVEQEDVSRGVQRIEEMLRGQVAGVEVRQEPSGLVIRIRGGSSNGFGVTTSDPLFVIDGLPIELGAPGALTGINPRDIQSIRVLKNASETAFYGSRGANGVILITTVRPRRPSDEGGE